MFTVENIDSIPATNENKVNVQTFERYLTDRIDRKMGEIVETVEDRIKNAVLTEMK